jgi:hypothetical protein
MPEQPTYADLLRRALEMEADAINMGLALVAAAGREAPGDVPRLLEIIADEVDHQQHYTAMLKQLAQKAKGSANDAKPAITLRYTLTCNDPILAQRIDRLMAWIDHTKVGHSGTVAMSIDGDGHERVNVEGITKESLQWIRERDYPSYRLNSAELITDGPPDER